MKLTPCAICAVGITVLNIGCTTQSVGGRGAVAGSVVTVQYVNPENFTDFSIHRRDVRYSTSVFTQEVTQTLEPVMKSRFPGDMLTLRFTNIDRAGRRSSVGASSVRVVRNRTPARLSFDYVLQDKSGRAVASGSQRLVDTAHTSSRNPSGPLSNENRMLRRWLQSLSVHR
jgi:hypothetical protein